MTDTPEKDLIRLCARTGLSDGQESEIGDLLEQDIEWSIFLLLARRHLVTPLMHESLSKSEYSKKVPGEIIEQLRDDRAKNLARNLQRYAELTSLLDVLASHSIKTVVLKGAALANVVYRDVSLRVYGDIDLLIPRDRLDTTKEIMTGLSYSLLRDHYSVPDELNEELGCEWTYFSPNTVIEIHWNLVEKVSYFQLNPNELIERAIPFQCNNSTALCLTPEDELLHLCIHQFKHHWYYLRDLCDVYALLKHHGSGFDWEILLARSHEMRADKCLYYTLLLSNRILEAPVPTDILVELKRRVMPSLIDRSIFDLIENNLLSLEVPHGYWPVILVDGIKAKMRVIRETTKERVASSNNENRLDEKKSESSGPLQVILWAPRTVLQYRKLLGQLVVLFSKNISGRFWK